MQAGTVLRWVIVWGVLAAGIWEACQPLWPPAPSPAPTPATPLSIPTRPSGGTTPTRAAARTPSPAPPACVFQEVPDPENPTPADRALLPDPSHWRWEPASAGGQPLRGIRGLIQPPLPWRVLSGGAALEVRLLLNRNARVIQVAVDLRREAHRRLHPEKAWDIFLSPELIFQPHVRGAAWGGAAWELWLPRAAAQLRARQETFPSDRIGSQALQVTPDGRVRLEDPSRGVSRDLGAPAPMGEALVMTGTIVLARERNRSMWWRGDAATGQWERLGEIPEDHPGDWVFRSWAWDRSEWMWLAIGGVNGLEPAHSPSWRIPAHPGAPLQSFPPLPISRIPGDGPESVCDLFPVGTSGRWLLWCRVAILRPEGKPVVQFGVTIDGATGRVEGPEDLGLRDPLVDLPKGGVMGPSFYLSPDGRWLAVEFAEVGPEGGWRGARSLYMLDGAQPGWVRRWPGRTWVAWDPAGGGVVLWDVGEDQLEWLRLPPGPNGEPVPLAEAATAGPLAFLEGGLVTLSRMNPAALQLWDKAGHLQGEWDLSAVVERIYGLLGEGERVWIGAFERVASGTPCRFALLELPLAGSLVDTP
jgi:hypothetical protein